MSRLQFGDHVIIENLGIQGQVIEADTRTVVVRFKQKDGELIERRFRPEDLTYIPKPQLE